MREPTVLNKYKLKPSDIKKLKVVKPWFIHELPFERNNQTNAWCIYEETHRTWKEETTLRYGTYLLSYYDNTESVPKSKRGKFILECSSCAGLFEYKFTRFYKQSEIETEHDLLVQEKIMEKLNWLLDKKILKLDK